MASRRNRLFLFVFVGLVLLGSPVLACLWDRDTLEQERQRFPSALELITGQFLRHSPAFYQWRVEDRRGRIEKDPDNLALYDDLAVAHEKLGQHDEAIEVILRKEELSPGLYETYANLGTFYVHSGKFQEGLTQIDRAIEINPDAHFGREVYQKKLVQYVLSRRIEGKVILPLDDSSRGQFELSGFAAFVLSDIVANQEALPIEETQRLIREESDRAIQGVLGMMRFGNHDSPILLEALADLLMARRYPEDAKLLATRALLKASYETEGSVSESYRRLAKSTLELQVARPGTENQMKLDDLEREFRRELKAAQDWYQQLESRERNWIEKGLDVESEFGKEYAREPEVEQSASLRSTDASLNLKWAWGLLVVVPIALIVGCRKLVR